MNKENRNNMTAAFFCHTGRSDEDEDSRIYRSFRGGKRDDPSLQDKNLGASFKNYIDDDFDDIDDNISISQHSYHSSHYRVEEHSPHEIHQMMPCDLDNPYWDQQEVHHQVEHCVEHSQTLITVQSVGLTCIYENDEYDDEGSTDIESVESGRTKRFKNFQNFIDKINVSVSTLASSKSNDDDDCVSNENDGKHKKNCWSEIYSNFFHRTSLTILG